MTKHDILTLLSPHVKGTRVGIIYMWGLVSGGAVLDTSSSADDVATGIRNDKVYSVSGAMHLLQAVSNIYVHSCMCTIHVHV